MLYSNIMKPVRFVLQPLLDLFQRLQVLTMPEMKAALGTQVDMTVFRKLATLGYLTSYSHRGSYYTLKSIPRFDAQGLWLARGAWFSRQGTLRNTAEAAVQEALAAFGSFNGGVILHGEIGPDVPFENIEALYLSFYKYGQYPLTWLDT